MKLEKYEEICPYCHGQGGEQPTQLNNCGWVCGWCDGRGKLSWIDVLKMKSRIDDLKRRFRKI